MSGEIGALVCMHGAHVCFCVRYIVAAGQAKESEWITRLNNSINNKMGENQKELEKIIIEEKEYNLPQEST